MKINTIKVWLIENNKSMKAKADVSFITDQGEISIKGFRIVQKGDVTFVGGPQEKYQLKGVMQYKEMLYVDRKFQAFLYSQILNEYKKITATLRVA